MEITEALLDKTLAGRWRSNAACSGVSPQDAEWFPSIHQAMDPRVRNAKAICNECPVRKECLLWGLYMVTAKEGGIYGGLTARQRVDMRNELAEEGHPVALRTCSHCNERYAAKLQTQREGIHFCFNCRESRGRQWDRDNGRSGTLSRAKYRLKRGLPLTAGEQAAVDGMNVVASN